jgi:hypothetical protein
LTTVNPLAVSAPEGHELQLTAINARQRHALLSLDRHHGALGRSDKSHTFWIASAGGMLTIAAVGLLTLGVWVVRDGLTA